jgi:hypothetical protein
MRVSNSPCIVILTSFYLAIAFLSSHHKQLLLITNVSSTNCPSPLELEIPASASKNDISEAIAVLLRDFTEEPRMLSSDDLQIAIEVLSTPDKANIFLALNRQHGMEEHRDRWLGRQIAVQQASTTSKFYLINLINTTQTYHIQSIRPS